jgi:hypothetical protein
MRINNLSKRNPFAIKEQPGMLQYAACPVKHIYISQLNPVHPVRKSHKYCRRFMLPTALIPHKHGCKAYPPFCHNRS